MMVSYKSMEASKYQGPLGSRDDMRWDVKRRTITIGNTVVKLTPVQYRLFLPLQYGVPISYHALARAAYDCNFDGKIRKMLDKHIDRIRGKMRGTGVYIYCVVGYGYLLFDENPTADEEGYDLRKRKRISRPAVPRLSQRLV